jgi:hypothetical protein
VVRHSCAPLLPAHNRHQSSPNPLQRPTFPLSFPVSRSGPRNRRSLGFAPPDFLLRLVALANFMRLSLRERRTRNRVQRSVAGNPGRDDKKERVVARKRRLLNRGIFKSDLDSLETEFSRTPKARAPRSSRQSEHAAVETAADQRKQPHFVPPSSLQGDQQVTSSNRKLIRRFGQL